MNELLMKLKSSLSPQVVNKVDKAIMESLRFVPVNIKDGFVFVAVDSTTDKNAVAERLKSVFAEQLKFIQIPDSDLPELIEICKPDIQMQGKIGEILVAKGYITDVQLLQGLAESKKQKMPLGSALFSMGHITLAQLKEILAMQTNAEVVATEQLAKMREFVTLLPEDFIRSHQVIPIHSDGKTLSLGSVAPLKPEVLKEIIYLTGQNPRQYLITHFEFEDAWRSHFSSSLKETQKVIRQMEAESDEFGNDATLWEQVEGELKDATGAVAKLVNQIITTAIEEKISDIHIEPRLTGYQVRYRKDGMLKKTFDIPPKVESSVLARFKVLSRLDIAEYRRPQDGTFSMKYNDNSYDFRIGTLPVSGKEKIVIRVLAPAVSLNAADKDINLVGASTEDIKKVKIMTSCPNGVILTSGPTGSGKTTTLYSILKSLNEEFVNIATIEDPVEIKLEGVNQTQVNPKAGITFASCMRAILRQDPDIILVGEIRDFETLEIAISAALTGHLVLSTVHTNSAAATVTRLIEMGAKDYLVASTLSGVIAQRLVRKLCNSCKEECHATQEEAKLIISDPAAMNEFMQKPIYKAKGCNNCEFTGYKGRMGLYEIMEINKDIKKLIASGAHDIEIEEAAVSHGMVTLRQSCIRHILNGETTVSEFIRVLGVVNE